MIAPRRKHVGGAFRRSGRSWPRDGGGVSGSFCAGREHRVQDVREDHRDHSRPSCGSTTREPFRSWRPHRCGSKPAPNPAAPRLPCGGDERHSHDGPVRQASAHEDYHGKRRFRCCAAGRMDRFIEVPKWVQVTLAKGLLVRNRSLWLRDRARGFEQASGTAVCSPWGNPAFALRSGCGTGAYGQEQAGARYVRRK